MINIKDVTLVCVACVRVNKAINAINYSIKGINFDSIKLITNEDVESKNFEIIKINKLNYDEYNRFIIFDLYKYISTKYALIIQDDGFIVNPESWMDDFLNYDYIGAPWPINHSIFSDKNNNLIRVGNGGFSLRSNKLLSIASEKKLNWDNTNEDVFICVKNRHIYEECGIKFAPIDVAKYFSHEFNLLETSGINPFGFHSSRQNYYNLIK